MTLCCFEANSFFVGYYFLHRNEENTYGQIFSFAVCQVEENLLNYFELTELISFYYYWVIFYEHYPITELK